MAIQHHIHVDSNGKATVRTTDLATGGPLKSNFVLNVDDEVIFTSNRAETEIRYPKEPPSPPLTGLPPGFQKGSPFKNLEPDTSKPADGFTTKLVVKFQCMFNNPFHFDCGRKVGGEFSKWGAQTGHVQGGSTPGPDD